MKLLRTDPDLAERQAREILKVLPHDARAHFIIGAAKRRAGDAIGARAVLEPLAAAAPTSAFALHELGLTLAGLGEGNASIDTLRRAAVLAQNRPDIWLSLSDQLALAGDAGGSAAAYDEHVRASVKEPNLRRAAAALRNGKLEDANRRLRRHLTASPNDVAALRMWGEVIAKMGHLEDAEEVLAHCVRLAPGFVGARHTYAIVLYQQAKSAEAVAQLEQLLAGAPGDAKYLALLAGCLCFIGAFERAMAIIQDLLRRHPTHSKVWLSYGQTLRITGQPAAAITAFKQALSIEPAMGEAWWSLADLKTMRFSAAEITEMRARLADPALSDDDRLHVHYALGKAMEDGGQWANSFAHYAQGAALRRRSQPHDADESTARMASIQRIFTRDFFASRPEGGDPDPAPIFIVGLPRSGSTLIEQILASHSMVEATMELPELPHIHARMGRAGRRGNGPTYEEAVDGLSADERTALGAEYLARAQPYRKLGRASFIDKMPANFLHAGLINLILPNARIIDVRRHPMAVCFSNYKQLFFRGQGFSYDLRDIARYYGDYVSLMAHFDAAMPGKIHRVIYEDVIEDTEAEVRRLLAFCGLPFEAGCVRFWENGRAVTTHSSEQVRRPIFRDGLDQWRHYETWLEPLRTALTPALEAWRR